MSLEEQSRWRSVAKGMTWRVAATLTTILLSFWLEGTIATALKIGPLDFILKLGVFYLHERLWLVPRMQQLENKRVLKMMLWKAVAVSMTVGTTVAVTGRLDLALKLGPADFFVKLFLYYAHEMLWDNIQFGKHMLHDKKSE